MNILHVIFSFKMGGAESMLRDIISIQKRYHQVSLIVINNVYDVEMFKDISKDVQIFRLERSPGSRSLVDFIRFNLLIAKIRPDIIHCHDDLIIKMFFLSFYSRKTILTVHCLGIESAYLKKFRKIVSISKAVSKDLNDRYGIESTVIYNGIFIKDIKAKSVNKNSDKIVNIVQVSRLDHEVKGQDLLIKAICELKKAGYLSFKVSFIGEGFSENYLRELSNKLNVQDQIFFLGKKSREYVYHHISDYDLLVQPSLSEGFGLTIVEAIAAKVPVLISNIEGPMEIIANGEHGSYFESGDVEKLTKALFNLKVNENIIQNAWKYVQENFDIQKTVSCYIDLYKSIN